LLKVSYETTNGTFLEEYTYDKKSQKIKTVRTNNKGQESITTTKWTSRGQIAEREYYGYKGDYRGSVCQYDVAGNLTLLKVYTKNKVVPTYSMEYTFYEDGSKKSTTFTKKGKVRYVWTFDCKPEGELLGVKKKDESTICINEELDADGNRVVWKRTFDEKGGLIKTKMVINPDSIVISKMIYNHNDRLLSEYQRHEDGSRATTNYDKRGKISSLEQYFYNDDENLTKHSKESKGYSFMHLYSYSGPLRTSQVRVYKRSTYIDEYQYTFYQ